MASRTSRDTQGIGFGGTGEWGREKELLMKRRIRIAAASVMVAAGLISAVAAPASASAPPRSITIELLRNGPPGFEATTWSASGAFVDSGTWTIDRFICGACPSPVTGAPSFDTTATSNSGTFEIRLRATFNLVQPNEVSLWEIVGGTGTYAHLVGQGTYEVQVDINGVRHIILTGNVVL
jgi:hypothetical protein